MENMSDAGMPLLIGPYLPEADFELRVREGCLASFEGEDPMRLPRPQRLKLSRSPQRQGHCKTTQRGRESRVTTNISHSIASGTSFIDSTMCTFLEVKADHCFRVQRRMMRSKVSFSSAISCPVMDLHLHIPYRTCHRKSHTSDRSGVLFVRIVPLFRRCRISVAVRSAPMKPASRWANSVIALAARSL